MTRVFPPKKKRAIIGSRISLGKQNLRQQALDRIGQTIKILVALSEH